VTISNQAVLVSYSGNSATTSFAITQSFQTNTEIDVYLVSSLGVETLLTVSTHYTFVGGNPATSITMLTAPATGEKLIIKRDTAKTQTADYLANGAFPAESHELTLDKIVQLLQELNYDVRRAIKSKLSDTAGMDLEYPSATDRANKYLGFDGSGVPVATTVIVPGSVTPYISTLLDDTTAADARTTLGFTGPSGTVSNANIRESAGVSIIGRSASSTGAVADITAGANGQVLKREADALVFDTVDTADITNLAVTNAKIADDTVLLAKISSTILTKLVVLNPGDFSSGVPSLTFPQYTFANSTKLTDPATLPSGAGVTIGLDCTPNFEYMACSSPNSPYVLIYQRKGLDLVKIADPGTLPGASGRSCHFTTAGDFLAVGSTSTPFITAYSRTGSVFTKLTNPVTLPAGEVTGAKWNPTGEFLACPHVTTPFVSIYQRTGSGAASVLTKIADPATLPASTGLSAGWSWDSKFLAIGHNTTPFVTIYERSSLLTFTKLADPATLPASAVTGCAFSPDGKYLATSHATSPYVTIYSKSGSTFTKLTDPVTLPAGAANGVSWNYGSNYLSVTHNTSPRVTIYDMSSGVPVKLTNPTTLPTANARNSAWSGDSQFLLISHDTAPRITVLQTGTAMPTTSIMVMDKIPLAGS